MTQEEYKEYLKSEHWQKIRMTAIKNADGRCQLCNSDKRLEVHHRTYQRVGKENIKDLTVLCHKCHKKFSVVTKRKRRPNDGDMLKVLDSVTYAPAWVAMQDVYDRCSGCLVTKTTAVINKTVSMFRTDKIMPTEIEIIAYGISGVIHKPKENIEEEIWQAIGDAIIGDKTL